MAFLMMSCFLVSLCLLVASILYFGPKVEHFSLYYLIDYSIYQFLPYSLLILFPIILGAVLSRLTRSKLNRSS